MAKTRIEMINHVKQYRQRAGLSQTQLADSVGIKRQAVYDIESGRYLPNTVVALRLAKCLGCRVEDLFAEPAGEVCRPVILAEDKHSDVRRVSLAKVRDRLVGYPVDGVFTFQNGLRPADGMLEGGPNRVRLLAEEAVLEKSILLTGCDPAFSLLAAHVTRAAPGFRVLCRFASSHRALDRLAGGMAHIAGTHLHNGPKGEANVSLARKKLAHSGGRVVGFSLMEEGLMVARGNPAGIRSAADLAQAHIRLVNREPGAALRVLLDEELHRAGIPGENITGYTHEVRGHSQGAQMVACGSADAALGLRAVASAYELDFVPITQVRCDLVIPADLMENQVVQLVMDIMQTRELRQELAAIPGYECQKTGDMIDSF